MQRTNSLTRKPMRRSYRYTGPASATVEACLERANYSCEIAGCWIGAVRGVDWSLHHRVARQAGGTRAAWINRPSNLLVVCGSGTTGCHGVIESHRAGAVAGGWLILARQNPLQVAVLICRDRWRYLGDDFRYHVDPPEVAA